MSTTNYKNLSSSPPLSPSPSKERGRWLGERGFAPLKTLEDD